MIGKLTNVEAEEIARTSVDLLRHNLSDCDVRSEILHGRASSELLREVARFEPEFLVMGSFGHSGVAKAIFGSAVDAILTHATCSVAIIKSTADKDEVVAHQPAVFSETRYLLCIDDSECGMHVIDSVSRRPWRPDAEFMAVRIVEPQSTGAYSENPKADAAAFLAHEEAHLEDLKLDFEKQLMPLKVALPGNSLKTTLKLDLAPQDTILSLAESWNANAVIMGSHRRKGLQKMFLGSVSEAVARQSTCSVEIIR
jgi:nucleotide-binding universal stress UspA family protein